MAMIIDTEPEESNMPLNRSIRYCFTVDFDSEDKNVVLGAQQFNI